jgi:hypothetical protein
MPDCSTRRARRMTPAARATKLRGEDRPMSTLTAQEAQQVAMLTNMHALAVLAESDFAGVHCAGFVSYARTGASSVLDRVTYAGTPTENPFYGRQIYATPKGPRDVMTRF